MPFSDDPAKFVSRALQPAKVKEVILDEERGRATVIVHDYQLSLTIGKEGQNARLAARLTGWHIDIKSESEAAEEAHYAEGEWAEGEWVEQSGEMVWKPAEGGETMSAEAWAAARKRRPRGRPANPVTPRPRLPPTLLPTAPGRRKRLSRWLTQRRKGLNAADTGTGALENEPAGEPDGPAEKGTLVADTASHLHRVPSRRAGIPARPRGACRRRSLGRRHRPQGPRCMALP